MKNGRFEDGVIAGGSVGCALLAVLLVLITPTNEFRVRLWFLLNHGRDMTLEVALFAVLWSPAALMLAATRRATAPGLLGACFAALTLVGILKGGGLYWIPELQSMPAQVVFLIAVTTAAVWTVRRRLFEATPRKRSADDTVKPSGSSASSDVT